MNARPDFAIAKSARLVPAFRFTFVNLQGRADRLNPRGFNLARRGNPKQISNANFGGKLYGHKRPSENRC